MDVAHSRPRGRRMVAAASRCVPHSCAATSAPNAGLMVCLVGGVAWLGSDDLSRRKLIVSTVKPLRVQVASLDWKWLFISPDEGVASVNYLAIPVGTPVSFEPTSSGVMNSFFVPQLGSQIYTMAGMVTRLHLHADHSGSYRGMSAQFTGEGIAD